MCLAVPGRLLTITNDSLLGIVGQVDFDGVSRQVNLSFLPDAKVGQYVVVHAGLAISVLNEDEAQATLDSFGIENDLSPSEES